MDVLIGDKLNHYRVFPRMFSIAYLYFMFDIGNWFTALQTPSVEQAGFATAVVTAAAAWFKFYVESGPRRKEE